MDGMPGYWLTRLTLQRGLGVVYLIAFLAAVNQFRPLCGERGLLPAPQFMREAPRAAPSIFFLFPRDNAFALVGWVGMLLAALAVTGVSERHGAWLSMGIWALLWVLYLSFVNVGQTFYGFGWESILLESGFLAIFLGAAETAPQPVMIWLYRWVLFRVMFGAGLIKLRGDPCWRNLTCLHYHFETQPMPNPLSWYFHRLPSWLHRGGVLFNHVVEAAAPIFYFAPQPYSAIAGILVGKRQFLLAQLPDPRPRVQYIQRWPVGQNPPDPGAAACPAEGVTGRRGVGNCPDGSTPEHQAGA